MRLVVVGTGSSGNAYLLDADGHQLLLDAGMPFRTIQQVVKRWSAVEACLITHEHGDHIKSAEDIAARGVPVCMSAGTCKACKVKGMIKPFTEVKPLSTAKFGAFTVLPFETEHDAAEPLGFLLRYNPTGETLLYATDTYYLRYTFPGVNYWLIECNHTQALLDAADIPRPLRMRLKESHMSLERLVQALQANDLTKTRSIIICHLSDERSDEQLMVDTIKQATGIDEVFAADAGLSFDLRLQPF